MSSTFDRFILIGLIAVMTTLTSCMESKLTFNLDKNNPLSFSYFVESMPDGSGVQYDDMSIYIAEEVTLYAVKRDSNGEYVENVAMSWSLMGGTGSLTIVGDGQAAEFSSPSVGDAQIRVLDDGEVIKVIDIEVTLPPSSELEVQTLVLSDITHDSFEASIDYAADYEENSTNTLSYCNRTAQPACDPVNDGVSVAMDRGASSLTASVSGLSPNADYAVRYVAVDPDGVVGSDVQNQTITLLDEPLTLSNLSITNTTKSGMNISVDFTGDLLDNGSATLYYCNETLAPDCDPEDSMNGGNSLAMTKNPSSFTASIAGLSTPDFNEADRVKIRIVANDPDGTVDSPMNSAAYLADLTLDFHSYFYLINTTRDSFEVKVDFVEDNTNGSVDLYYCNATLDSACDPEAHDMMAMTRDAGNGEFYANATGVTSGYSEGDMVKIRFVGSDPDGVRHVDNPMERSFRLTGIELDNIQIGRVLQDQFYISLNYEYDRDGDYSAQAYYCNDTNNPGCDPLSGTMTTLSKSGDMIQGYVSDLMSSHDPGDILKLRVEVSDPDGVYAQGAVVSSPGVFEIDVIIPDPTSVFRSVGVGETNALTSSTLSGATLSINSGNIASFSSPLADSVGVGDVLIYDSNGNAGMNPADTVLFIAARIDSSTFGVMTFDGQDASPVISDEDWEIYRAYTSLNAALTGDENPGIPAALRDFDTWTGGHDISAQTGSDMSWHIALYASGEADQTPINLSSPWKTDWANKIHIFTPNLTAYSAQSQRHQGAWDSSLYTFETSSSEDFKVSGVSSVIIEGLQIHHIGSENDATTIRFYGAEMFVFTSNLVRSSSTGTGLRGFRAGAGLHGANVNNVYFGYSTVGSYAVDNQWEINESRKAHYNNTFYDVYHAMRYTNNHNYISSSAKNNLALNCVSDCYVDFFSRSINPRSNASSDDSANSIDNDSGTGQANVGDASLHLEDPIGMDFRMRASSPLIDKGTNLADDPNNIFDFDFDFLGNSRPAAGAMEAWSIGASQP